MAEPNGDWPRLTPSWALRMARCMYSSSIAPKLTPSRGFTATSPFLTSDVGWVKRTRADPPPLACRWCVGASTLDAPYLLMSDTHGLRRPRRAGLLILRQTAQDLLVCGRQVQLRHLPAGDERKCVLDRRPHGHRQEQGRLA